MTKVAVAHRWVTQKIHGEALPQTRIERVWRRVEPLPHPRDTRRRWSLAADLVEVACWGAVGMGLLIMIAMVAYG